MGGLALRVPRRGGGDCGVANYGLASVREGMTATGTAGMITSPFHVAYAPWNGDVEFVIIRDSVGFFVLNLISRFGGLAVARPSRMGGKRGMRGMRGRACQRDGD